MMMVLAWLYPANIENDQKGYTNSVQVYVTDRRKCGSQQYA